MDAKQKKLPCDCHSREPIALLSTYNMLQLLVVTASLCAVVVSRVTQLDMALQALDRSLRYMGDRVEEINLDGVLGTRLVDEQLSAYLVFEPHVMGKIQKKVEKLRNKARRISDEGMIHVQRNEPKYSSRLGNVMMRSPKLMWYPSLNTDQQMMEAPLPCSMSVFNETVSDGCLQNIVGKGNKKNTCILTPFCDEMTTLPRQQGYRLTHQLLYWQLAEMRNCIPKTDESLRLRFCSNVMRDANRIAIANYPRNHRDLFMEQIGLCGMWGFRDFYQPQWLKKIIQWQEPSGCYGNVAKWHCTDNILPEQYRVKRKEKKLDGGCLSHKTAVALIALTVNIRFLAERVY